jgi:hypothetical protein
MVLVGCLHKYGFIDKQGNLIIEPLYNTAWDFSEGIAFVKKDDYYGCIDKNGTEVLPFVYKFGYKFKNGLALVRLKNGGITYIDKNGNEYCED